MKVTIDIDSLAVGDAVATKLHAAIRDTSGAEVASADIGGVSARFDAVDDGAYTAYAQRVDGAGAAVGDALTSPFVVVSSSEDRTAYSPSGLNVSVRA